MGMTGWGLDVMVRALDHLGPKADPDVVVLPLYSVGDRIAAKERHTLLSRQMIEGAA